MIHAIVSNIACAKRPARSWWRVAVTGMWLLCPLSWVYYLARWIVDTAVGVFFAFIPHDDDQDDDMLND